MEGWWPVAVQFVVSAVPPVEPRYANSRAGPPKALTEILLSFKFDA
jgi:hypothetical protein